MKLRAELLRRFVLIEPAGDVRRALDEDAAGRADIHRVEVEAVLDLGRVGVPELLVDRLLLHERLVRLDVEGDVMRRPGAEAPASGIPVRFVVQIHDPAGAGAWNFESMIRAVDSDLPEAERVDEKRFLIANVAHRQHGAEKAARPDVPAHLLRRPGMALIARVLDHLEEESGRMAHAKVLGAKPLLHAAMLRAVSVEVRLPERRRPLRDRITGGGKLARTGATRLARVRK